MLSIFGDDKPGIVAKITKELFELNLNLEDSSMTRLGSQFGILLMLSGESSCECIKKALSNTVKELDLSILCKAITLEPHKPNSEKSYRIILHGEDKIGIVYRVSTLISALGLNIIDLRTIRHSDIYLMIMEVQGEVSQDELREKLQELSKELELSLDLEEEEGIGL
ncbi:MAG: ACT domain-containing protein [Aquificaceae bacterium]|nr:ACT domain-containing protein [Aquificaceae bacterium]MDW8237692.1 ACT domain-containing protein [Aquificaceae bacterium]